MQGSSIPSMIENNIKEGDNRFDSGNVLTGTKISKNGNLGFYHNEITVIPEGKEQDFLGLLPD